MESVFKIAKNSFILMLSEIINKVISLCLVIVLARYLGQVQFGRYSFVITMMLLFQVLAEFGLDGLTIREIAKNKSKANHYLSNVLVLKMFLGIITFFLISSTTFFLNKPDEVCFSIIVAGAAIIFSSLSNTFFSVFNAYEKLEYKALINIFCRILTLILSLGLIIIKAGLLQFISVILVSEIFKVILGVYFYRKSFKKIQFSFNFSTCIQFLKTSVPFALIGIISLIYFRIDIVMLSIIANDEMVGFYSAASALLVAFLFITEAYMLSVFPALARSAQDAKKMLFFIWERSVKYLLVLSLFLTIFIKIFAKDIIILIFSDSYMPSVRALQVLIWTLPWIFVNAINMRVLYAADKQKQATVVAFLSMLLNVLLNFFLIPQYGFIGAALATIVAEVLNVMMYFYLIYVLLKMKLPFYNITKPVLGLSGAMLLFMFLRQNNQIISGLALIAAYTAALFLLRVFDKEDLRIFKKLVPALREK